jgi:hypothetical protein
VLCPGARRKLTKASQLRAARQSLRANAPQHMDNSHGTLQRGHLSGTLSPVPEVPPAPAAETHAVEPGPATLAVLHQHLEGTHAPGVADGPWPVDTSADGQAEAGDGEGMSTSESDRAYGDDGGGDQARGDAAMHDVAEGGGAPLEVHAMDGVLESRREAGNALAEVENNENAEQLNAEQAGPSGTWAASFSEGPADSTRCDNVGS